MNDHVLPAGASFELTDHMGGAVTLESYRGRFAVVFFGFTRCKAVCPQALRRLSGVLDDLGPLADEITALYVTVDPERDTPDVMRAFLARDYPRFTGLTSDRKHIDEAKRAFRVFAERRDDLDDPDGYAVPHTAITYVLDRDGIYATHFTDGVPEEEIVVRLRSLVGS